MASVGRTPRYIYTGVYVPCVHRRLTGAGPGVGRADKGGVVPSVVTALIGRPGKLSSTQCHTHIRRVHTGVTASLLGSLFDHRRVGVSVCAPYRMGCLSRAYTHTHIADRPVAGANPKMAWTKMVRTNMAQLGKGPKWDISAMQNRTCFE